MMSLQYQVNHYLQKYKVHVHDEFTKHVYTIHYEYKGVA